jgi:hypothetical protein
VFLIFITPASLQSNLVQFEQVAAGRRGFSGSGSKAEHASRQEIRRVLKTAG